MTRNDTLFKILFAIEVALLPLTMAAYLLMPKWSVVVFIAGVLIAKIWMEIFKSKEIRSHGVINAIGSFLAISSLVIFFTACKYLNVVLCVFVVVFALLMTVLKIVLRDDFMPEIIDAVDSCYVLFECLSLVGLSFVVFYALIANISLFALILTAVVSVGYKTYRLCAKFSLGDRIKNLLRRK
jgi:hypothetical protein